LRGVMTPAIVGVMTPTLLGASYCSNCDRRVASIKTDKLAVLLAAEFAPDGHTPTELRHVCRARR